MGGKWRGCQFYDVLPPNDSWKTRRGFGIFPRINGISWIWITKLITETFMITFQHKRSFLKLGLYIVSFIVVTRMTTYIRDEKIMDKKLDKEIWRAYWMLMGIGNPHEKKISSLSWIEAEKITYPPLPFALTDRRQTKLFIE